MGTVRNGRKTTEEALLSYEIQAFAYRHVLRIIKDRGCSYDEAWKIFEKEMQDGMNQTKQDTIQKKMAEKLIREVEGRLKKDKAV